MKNKEQTISAEDAINLSRFVSEKMDELGNLTLSCCRKGEEESYYQGMFHALMRVKTWTWVLKKDEDGKLVFSIDYVQDILEKELSNVIEKLGEEIRKNARNKARKSK